MRALVPLVRAKASSIQAMHHPHKVTIVSNGGCAKTCKIPVSLGGMNIHKYQIFSFVCPKMGSSILSAVPAWLVDHHFPYQMACVQLDFLKDPPQKKKKHYIIYYPLDSLSNIFPIQIIKIIDSASLVLGYTPFPDTSILPRPGPLGKLRTAA